MVTLEFGFWGQCLARTLKTNWEQRSQSPDFNGSKQHCKCNAHRSLVTAHCLRHLRLSCCTEKTLNPCSIVGLWITPTLLCLPPSLSLLLFPSSSSLVNISALAQMNEGAALQSCKWALRGPAPWRGEKQDFISYASFSISALSPEEHAEGSALLYSLCAVTFPLRLCTLAKNGFVSNGINYAEPQKLFFFSTGNLKSIFNQCWKCSRNWY